MCNIRKYSSIHPVPARTAKVVFTRLLRQVLGEVCIRSGRGVEHSNVGVQSCTCSEVWWAACEEAGPGDGCGVALPPRHLPAVQHSTAAGQGSERLPAGGHWHAGGQGDGDRHAVLPRDVDTLLPTKLTTYIAGNRIS